MTTKMTIDNVNPPECMHGRLPCVGRTDAGMLRTGDPAGLGRLRRDRWPVVRPRSVSYSGGRAAAG